jgi:antitoxin HigA-1
MKLKSSITTRKVTSLKRPKNGWNITRKPVHPGEMLREEFMIPLGLSANRLAVELRVPVTRITQILNEHRSITADTALRLERYFGMDARFWMNLQKTMKSQRLGSSKAQRYKPTSTLVRLLSLTTHISTSRNARFRPSRAHLALLRVRSAQTVCILGGPRESSILLRSPFSGAAPWISLNTSPEGTEC